MDLEESLRAVVADVVRDVLRESVSKSGQLDPWLPMTEIGEVSQRQLEVAIRTGDLLAQRIGRRVLVRRSDLDAWIARPEHRVRPVAVRAVADDEPQSHAAKLLARAGGGR